MDDIITRLVATVPPLELLRIVSMSEAERLSSASIDTLEREYSDKIISISPRRRGMRVIDALLIRERG